MKRQVVAIHGAETYSSYEDYLDSLVAYRIESLDYFKRKGWKSDLQEMLGDSFDVILPRMPNAQNSKYFEWKIWFEKLVPFLEDGVLLLGHSLGGIFLAKYLSENIFPKKIGGVFLVAAPHDEEDMEESLGGFVLPQSLEKLEKQGGEIFLYFSKDDHSVPFSELAKYEAALPSATVRVFEDRGHFNQETFPEIVEDIRNLA